MVVQVWYLGPLRNNPAIYIPFVRQPLGVPASLQVLQCADSNECHRITRSTGRWPETSQLDLAGRAIILYIYPSPARSSDMCQLPLSELAFLPCSPCDLFVHMNHFHQSQLTEYGS
jgi:hypothetical protein